MTFLIFFNVIILAMPFKNQPDAYTLTLFILNLVCLIFLKGSLRCRRWSKLFHSRITIFKNLNYFEIIKKFLKIIFFHHMKRLLKTLKLARKWEKLEIILQAIGRVILFFCLLPIFWKINCFSLRFCRFCCVFFAGHHHVHFCDSWYEFIRRRNELWWWAPKIQFW